MMQGSRAITIWVTAGACALIFIATTVIAAPLPPLPLDPFWLTFLGLPLVGAFILTKRPGNAVGAVLLAIGASAVGFFAVFLPSDDPLVVAVSTLVVFALFDPVRRRVQDQVDRRFHRSRYDASRVIDDFTGTLQYRVDPDGVVHDWVGVVEETMQPVSVGVWVREA